MTQDHISEARAAAEQLRARGHKPNPGRMGKAMGDAHFAAFDAWSAAARVSHNYEGRPKPPGNPYMGHSLKARLEWEGGWRWAVRDYEARKRCGGKRPSMEFSTGSGR